MAPRNEMRRVIVLTREGIITGKVSMRDASKVGTHWNAVKSYLNTGKTIKLEEAEGERILINGERYTLETDIYEIDEWAETGELDIDDIYEYQY